MSTYVFKVRAISTNVGLRIDCFQGLLVFSYPCNVAMYKAIPRGMLIILCFSGARSSPCRSSPSIRLSNKRLSNRAHVSTSSPLEAKCHFRPCKRTGMKQVSNSLEKQICSESTRYMCLVVSKPGHSSRRLLNTDA